MTALENIKPQLDQIQKRSLRIGIASLAFCAAGAAMNPAQFFQSYLVGYLLWFGITIGCFAIVMLHHLVGGGWGFVIQRSLEAGSRTLPLMLLLFIPVVFGAREIYLWAQPDAIAGDELLQHKTGFLNVPFFGGRALLYFAIWMLLAYLINRWSGQQDRNADPNLTERIKKVSGPGLVVYVLTMTFASVDWVMSLEPHWYSTIFGLIFVVSQGLITLAFAIIVAEWLADREPLSKVVEKQHFHDLGNLLMAFVMLWAYVAFSQFLLIWSGNLPEETPWYIHRLNGGWGVIAIVIVLFHFAIPFVLLLSRKTKRNREILAKVAMLMIFMRFVDLFWMVTPAFHPERLSLHWMDILAPVGLGGIWVAAFIWQLKGRPLLPLHDPRLEAAFQHE